MILESRRHYSVLEVSVREQALLSSRLPVARPPISLFSVGRDLITSIMRTSKVTSLSLPPKLLREAERLARREGRTKSELLREALRRYVADSRWRELQEFGRSQSRKLRIKESDVERLIQEYRNGTLSAQGCC